MFEVRCEGCQAPFEVDERRVPKNGMRMRCPKCGASFTVRRPDSPGAGSAPMAGPSGTTGETSIPMPADLVGPSPQGAVALPQTVTKGGPAPFRPKPPPLPGAAPRDSGSLPVPQDLALGLPSVLDTNVGLPAVAGTVGLPTPVAHGADLPALSGAGLPAVAGAVGLPSLSGTGLPAPAAGLPVPAAGLPVPAAGLPVPAAGLPVPAAGLPIPAAGLPMPTASLPSALDSGATRSTAPMGTGIPDGDDGGEAVLPLSPGDMHFGSLDGSLSEPGRARTATGSEPPGRDSDPDAPRDSGVPGLPGKEGFKLGRIGLERKAFTVSSDVDLPQAASNIGLPVVASTSRGLRGARRDEVDLSGVVEPSRVAPTPPPPRRAASGEFGSMGASVEAPSRPAGGGFGEIELGGDMLGAAFPPPPTPMPPPPAPPIATPPPAPPLPVDRGASPRASDVGGEFDSIPGVQDHRAPPPPPQEPVPTAKPKFGTPGFGEFRQAERIAPISQRLSKAQKALYSALTIVAVVVVGGASLAATPYGAFGKIVLDERFNGPARHEAAARVIAYVDQRLDQDTYDLAVAALHRLDEAEVRVPAERELKAYIVYANNLVVARFGADPARTSRAHTLLTQLAEVPDGTRYLALARGSDALARGEAAAALRTLRTESDGRDLATLAADTVGDPTQTLRLARLARERRASPRARYLFARALWESGDVEAAKAEAESLLHLEARHVGGRILLARLLDATDANQIRALGLVRDLVDDRPSAHAGSPAHGVAAAPVLPIASLAERAEANVVAGQIEFARDHVSAAQARFQRALELDPRSAQALVGLGDILFRQGSYTDAQARFRNAFSAEHNNVDAAIGIAESCLALNQAADARTAIEPVVHDHPNDPRLHYWFGKALASGVERTTAEREFREAIRLQPANLEPYVALSELFIQMTRPADAERILNDARAHVPDGAALHRALAHAHYTGGDLPGAESELRIALQRDPEDLRATFSLGEVYRRMQRLDDAEREFARVAQADADYPGLALARGQLDEARGQLPQALATFQEALARDPTNVELIVRVASTNVALANFNAADEALRSVVVDHPTNAEAQYILGRARLGQYNYTDAVRYFDRAIELNPQRADFKAYGAEAHRQIGDITNALHLAEQSIALDANFPRGYWVRAEISVHHGAALDALMDVRHTLQLDPHFWPAYATWGDVDDALSHQPEAIVQYRIATEHDATHGDWFYTLGRLLADSANEGAARTAFLHAIEVGRHLTTKPSWYIQSLRLAADSSRDQNRAEARRLYSEWLQLVPSTTSGYREVQGIVMDLNH